MCYLSCSTQLLSLFQKFLAAWHGLVRSKRAQKVADALAAEEAREQDKQKRQQQRQAARKGQQPKGARRDASAAKNTATVTAAEPMQAVSAEAATALGPSAGTSARGAAPTKGSESDSDGKPASPGWRITTGREATASRLECELAAAQSLHFAPMASQNAAMGKLATAQRLLLPTEPNKSQASGMLEAELAAAQSLCLPPRASQSPARGKPAGAAAAEAMGSPAGGSAKHVLAPENKARPATSLEAFFPPEQATAASPTGQHGQRGPGRGDSGASETPLAQAAHPEELSQRGPEWQPVSRSERKRNKKRAVRAATAGPAADQGPADAQAPSGGRAATAAAKDVTDQEAGGDGLGGGFWAGWPPVTATPPIPHVQPTGSTAELPAADSNDLEGILEGSRGAGRKRDDLNKGLCTSSDPGVEASTSASEPSKPAAPRLLMEDRECVMCLSEPPMTWLAPCGHQALCLGCTEQLFGKAGEPHVAGLCPVCRLPVLSYIAALFTT